MNEDERELYREMHLSLRRLSPMPARQFDARDRSAMEVRSLLAWIAAVHWVR